jgi:hypothetical protein
MASIKMKQTCPKCRKSGGIVMCFGCQQSFCIQHRQELSEQMDGISQAHDLLRRDLKYEKSTQSLSERINHWEQESIKIIQETAKKARADLQQLLEKNKNELRMSVDRLMEELRTCRESDDYAEIDIKTWTGQLKELRQMVKSSSIIKIECDNNTRSAIGLIKVSGSQQPLVSIVQKKMQMENNTRTPERFTEIYGNILLSIDGLTGWCSHRHWAGSCISGIGRYSSKKHHIRFRIEEKTTNYLFFGIITASQELTSSITEAKSAYGWWELGYTIVNGRLKDKDLAKIIRSGDEVTLILDCDNRQIQFEHHRTNTSVRILVDLEQCPFPWKIVLRMDSERDCIKILH